MTLPDLVFVDEERKLVELGKNPRLSANKEIRLFLNDDRTRNAMLLENVYLRAVPPSSLETDLVLYFY